jgi:hypothetical protein
MKTEPMPTNPGDIVVTHSAAEPASYHVWRVQSLGQQSVGSSGYEATVSGLIATLQLIDTLTAESPGSIFLRELDTLKWSRLSE